MEQDAQGITMEDFMDELIANEDGEADTSTQPETQEQEVVEEQTTETEETEVDVADEDDYLADVDEDEVDDTPEDEESEEEAEETADTTVHKFKADGEEVEVTTDELIKSYGLQKKLTREGQQLAEEKKQLANEQDAIAYIKQTPERQAAIENLRLMQLAVDRGYQVMPDGTPRYDENGQVVYLNKETLDSAPAAIKEQQEAISKMAVAPMQKEAYEAIPELWSSDAKVQQATANRYGDYLKSIGYTDSELPHISPRELLLAKAALEGDALAKRVAASKARKAEKAKPGVVSKTTKAAKGKPESSNQRGESKPKLSEAQIAEKVQNGELSISDAFMDLD